MGEKGATPAPHGAPPVEQPTATHELTHALTLRIDFLPPSINAVKTISRHEARIIYTASARDFLDRFRREIVPKHHEALQRFKAQDHPETLYNLHIQVKVPRAKLLCKSWWEVHARGPKKGLRKQAAKTPYRKWDVSNLFKLAEDAISEAAGVDDSRFWHVSAQKIPHGRDAVSMEITLRVMERPTGLQEGLFDD